MLTLLRLQLGIPPWKSARFKVLLIRHAVCAVLGGPFCLIVPKRLVLGLWLEAWDLVQKQPQPTTVFILILCSSWWDLFLEEPQKKKKNWSWESFYVLLKQKNSYCEQEETNYDPKRKKHNLYSQTGSAVILLLRQKRFSSCPAIRAANGNVKA